MKTEEKPLEFIITPTLSGKRIDKLLAVSNPEFSRSYVKKLILQGFLYVDSRNIKDPSFKVISDQKIKIKLPDIKKLRLEAQAIPLDILYEDDYLIVINKKSGMVVHPGPGNYKNTLVNALLHHCGENLSVIGGFQRPGIIHRLDKFTSGLMLVAKTDEAHRVLSKDINLKKVERIYQVFVWGVPNVKMGEIILNIGRNPNNRLKMSVFKKGGRYAVTKYKILKSYKFASKVQCTLLTGRTHQIRVHLSFIGFPIIGDHIYSKSMNKSKFMPNIMTDFSRQALHSSSISFQHPINKSFMVFKKDFPTDMKNLENELIKFNTEIDDL